MSDAVFAWWTARDRRAIFRAAVFLCRTFFEPARLISEAALESASVAFSRLFSSIAVRTSLTAVFTVERTCRFLAFLLRLCFCRLMPDFSLPNGFLLGMSPVFEQRNKLL